MTPTRLPGLQSLRALAAIMVLIGHVLAEAEHFLGLSLPGDAIPWTHGVDIFFVISGFVVTLSAQRFVGQPGAFFLRRMLRVAPLYFLFTTLMVAVLLVFPGGIKDTSLDPAQIISSYTFFPYARDDGRIAPVLSLGWTLNYEVFFYALLALCLVLPRPLLSVSAIVVLLALVGLLAAPAQPQLAFWTNSLILEFLFGMGLARLWQAGHVCPSLPLALGVLVAGLGLLVVLDPLPLPRFVAAGWPAVVIVAAGTLFCPRHVRPFQLLGDASYALYLSHRFTLRAATLLILPLVPPTQAGGLIFVALVSALALAVGVLTYLVVERPILRLLARPEIRRIAA